MSETHCQTCGHSLDVIEKKGHGPACWLTPEESAAPVPAPAAPAETPDREQAIREALAARPDVGRTHWAGCETDPRHRDCAIAFLLAEVTRLRAEVERLTAARRQDRAALIAQVDAERLAYSNYRSDYDEGFEAALAWVLDRLREGQS